MPFVFYNPNPKNQRVGDCAVRAISKAIGMDWSDAFIGLSAEGLALRDMPSANYVWGMYLKKYGFEEHMISSICPECTTVKKFAEDHPKGRYVLACQNHVVAVVDGNYYDTWDSGGEIVLYFFKEAITDKKSEDIWRIMDELMATLEMLQPKLYRATIDKIRG